MANIEKGPFSANNHIIGKSNGKIQFENMNRQGSQMRSASLHENSLRIAPNDNESAPSNRQCDTTVSTDYAESEELYGHRQNLMHHRAPTQNTLYTSGIIHSVNPYIQQPPIYMNPHLYAPYGNPILNDRTYATDPFTKSHAQLQSITMRIIGQLTLYVPHREPFLGEGGSVHLYLLGKQIQHQVASDDSENWTKDITRLIRDEKLPNETSMPLLLHDNRVVCGGPEVCLRYISKKLGHYGLNHVQDAVIDRLLTDMSTWFNVQQAAIQNILNPEQYSHETVKDYIMSRRQFYMELENLLSFYSGHTIDTNGDVLPRGESSATAPLDMGHAPFFLGELDSIADYFLFSLLDDDQRIVEYVSTHSKSSMHHLKNDNERANSHEENSHDPLEMHYFNICPHLHALYASLLSLPLVQEALLSGEGNDNGRNQPNGTSSDIPSADKDNYQKSTDMLSNPYQDTSTQISTVASINDWPMMSHHVMAPAARYPNGAQSIPAGRNLTSSAYPTYPQPMFPMSHGAPYHMGPSATPGYVMAPYPIQQALIPPTALMQPGYSMPPQDGNPMLSMGPRQYACPPYMQMPVQNQKLLFEYDPRVIAPEAASRSDMSNAMIRQPSMARVESRPSLASQTQSNACVPH